jgi:DNA-binding transcriptional regulator YiaG
LAHWIISQRTIHVVLAPKSSILRPEKPLPTAIKTLGDFLLAHRKAAGLTQEKAAELAGIHRQWLGRWERGRALPSPADWSKLRTVLALPAEAKFP